MDNQPAQLATARPWFRLLSQVRQEPPQAPEPTARPPPRAFSLLRPPTAQPETVEPQPSTTPPDQTQSPQPPQPQTAAPQLITAPPTPQPQTEVAMPSAQEQPQTAAITAPPQPLPQTVVPQPSAPTSQTQPQAATPQPSSPTQSLPQTAVPRPSASQPQLQPQTEQQPSPPPQTAASMQSIPQPQPRAVSQLRSRVLAAARLMPQEAVTQLRSQVLAATPQPSPQQPIAVPQSSTMLAQPQPEIAAPQPLTSPPPTKPLDSAPPPAQPATQSLPMPLPPPTVIQSQPSPAYQPLKSTISPPVLPSSRNIEAYQSPSLQSPKVIKTSNPTPPSSPQARQLQSSRPAPPMADLEPEMKPPLSQPKSIIMQEEATNGATKSRLQPQVTALHPTDKEDKNASLVAKSPQQRAARKKEEADMSIITMAGENIGAHMELGYPSSLQHHNNSRKQQGAHPHHPVRHNESHGFEGKSGEEQQKTSKVTPKVKPIVSLVNSNVQSVNNSILLNTSCTARNPGVHITLFSRRPKPRIPTPPSKGRTHSVNETPAANHGY